MAVVFARVGVSDPVRVGVSEEAPGDGVWTISGVEEGLDGNAWSVMALSIRPIPITEMLYAYGSAL